jgi:uncharacterized protein (AIM24 family)
MSVHHRLSVALRENTDDTWQIMGLDSEVVMLSLKPGESVVCEPGAMIAHDDGVEAMAVTGSGLWDIVSRYTFGGEKILQDKYTNAKSSECKSITLTVPFPGGKIVPVMLDKVTSMVFCPGAWLASKGTDIHFDATLVKSIYAGVFAGRGFVLPTISGSSPTFLCGGGTILSRILRHRESIVIDETSFLACECTVDIKACRAGSVSMMLCGGEGAFQCKLTGPGMVILQSMPVTAMTQGTASAAKMANGIKMKRI